MILELRSLLRRQRQIPLKELAEALGSDPETVRPMLERLIRRGEVERLPSATPCPGGCTLCPPQTVEIYLWIADNDGET
ncbi:putative ferrous iron transport protein C [Methylomarinovum caldicuralii]|uniref:Ferrous iron transport protein C n=1 Tax=Methylomarinovum caldicuralii TaxID=438856 RepID=A0AAU9CR44_9GAMM|nr:FeoC-like transcriptional regulator [Methylomarinovum caldicuralii]BCX82433.1 putative ferrous iron transport protein C [Methylomarinovum caldicuralii]